MLLQGIDQIPAGSNGLLFTPYIVGERTPHPDANIRGSFIGMDAGHKLEHFGRAVMEGITFSLRESIDILRGAGKSSMSGLRPPLDSPGPISCTRSSLIRSATRLDTVALFSPVTSDTRARERGAWRRIKGQTIRHKTSYETA